MTNRCLSIALGTAVALAAFAASSDADACTNFLVTKGASADGSNMISYTADSHDLFGELYYKPEAKYPKGTEMQVIEWDTGKPLAKIPQAEQVYRVVGNMNEHQLSIGETTWGGREELANPKGGIDYGSLIYISLQRCKTAREAIDTIVKLAAEHGYASEGETFSIADTNEVWLMDLIGKGPGSKGIEWVAMKVPDGFVTAHANQARIRKFPRNDPNNVLFSKTVVSFAREKGWYKGTDEDFSFADVYEPQECVHTRACDGRVWAFYNRIAPSQKIPIDYIKCVPNAPPLPLWIKPDKKLTPRDLFTGMRDHFEGTELDMTTDIGAGPYKTPYRWRPMEWTIDGKKYIHERAVSTQQTGFSFVAQSRPNLPNPIGGLVWFSVDDTATAVYFPVYMGVTAVPKSYKEGFASFEKYSPDSAFWVFNQVSNRAYGRWSEMIVDIQKVQGEFENEFFTKQAEFEQKAVEEFKKDPKKAEEMLTNYTVDAGERVVARFKLLDQQLLMKYLDGNLRNPGDKKAGHPRYPDDWYRKIVKETGDRYFVGLAPAPSGSAALASAPVASSPYPKEYNPPGAKMLCSTSAGNTGSALALLGLTAAAVGLLGRRRRAS